MIALTLSNVAAIVGGAAVVPSDRVSSGAGPAGPDPACAEPTISSVVTDSREVTAGSLFVALVGEQVDGHDFVAAAAERGASAALVSREGDFPIPTVRVTDPAAALAALAREVLVRLRALGRLTVVGVTGSVGKTSTKDLLASLLAPLGAVVAPVASFNNEIGLPLTVLRSDESTRILVLEMGADAPGNLDFLCSIAPPDIAVVLIVGRAHLGGFGSIDGVASAKAELVEGLVPGGLAILNADDPRVAAMAPLADRVHLFGVGPAADVRAEGVRTDADGHARFTLVRGADRVDTRLALVGEHHVVNALAAAAVAVELGRPLGEVAADLGAVGAASPHRMQVTDTPDGIRIIDDAYNANPDSMRAALAALARMSTERRSIAVLGTMRELGTDSEAEHEALGALAIELGIDHVVVVGESARGILTGAAAAGGGERSRFVTDADAALTDLRASVRPGDVLLIKSSNGVRLYTLAEQLCREADRTETRL